MAIFKTTMQVIVKKGHGELGTAMSLEVQY